MRAIERALVSIAASALLAACSNSGTNPAVSAKPSPVPTEVTKQIFGTVDPASAKGQQLYLYTVIIPPGQQIPAHTHPGSQMGHIDEGTLTYTVLQGTATVIRQAGTAEEQSMKLTGPADPIELQTGDTIVETPGMVHTAANNGTVPVTVILSSLFPKGAELSSPVPEPTP